MNELTIFKNEQFGEIRTIVKNDEIWFVGKDVATALGYSNPSNAVVTHVDDDDKTTYLNQVSGSNYKSKTAIINESGLYSLVLSSKLPTAKKFKRWVTLEVLPSIRKHGGYLTPAKIEEVLLNPDTIIKLATDLKEERAKRVEVEKQLEINKPKVLFAEAVATAKTSILIGELAKLIKQNGYDIGQKRLFQYLRENGYLIKQKGSAYNSPTQKSMDMGLFEIKERTINHSDHIEIVKTTKVTGKGQIYFINLFSKLERKSA
ncbi:phage antirepressor [uncultured Megamonas sp.]|uniref:phage antirepressor n=1 Tax=uncultured Megamonas sp. TaxID=286140 RepID=UPI00259AC7B0|nr:phage antirepressor [uncultured Megamonas sp.]